jgi:hypothetical protein
MKVVMCVYACRYSLCMYAIYVIHTYVCLFRLNQVLISAGNYSKWITFNILTEKFYEIVTIIGTLQVGKPNLDLKYHTHSHKQRIWT